MFMARSYQSLRSAGSRFKPGYFTVFSRLYPSKSYTPWKDNMRLAIHFNACAGSTILFDCFFTFPVVQNSKDLRSSV